MPVTGRIAGLTRRTTTSLPSAVMRRSPTSAKDAIASGNLLLDQWLPGARVPSPHRPVLVAGDDHLTTPGPAHRHRAHVVAPAPAHRHRAQPVGVVGQWRGERFPGGRVPDPHRLVSAAWPVRGPPTGSPVAASQTRTAPSYSPETITSRPPARPTATAWIELVWPASGAPTGSPLAASQTRTASEPAETITSRPPARPTATASTLPVWPARRPVPRWPRPRSARSYPSRRRRSPRGRRPGPPPPPPLRGCARLEARRPVPRWPRPRSAPSCPGRRRRIPRGPRPPHSPRRCARLAA